MLSPVPPCPGSSLSNDDDDCRVTLASLRGDADYCSNSSPFDSLHRGHQTLGRGHTPAVAHSNLHNTCYSNTIYSHCHYQALPPLPPVHGGDPLLPCQTQSICECSLQTIPQGTLERQFPHLYSRNNGTLLHSSNIYDSGRGRSQSLSPSRRSAEY